MSVSHIGSGMRYAEIDGLGRVSKIGLGTMWFGRASQPTEVVRPIVRLLADVLGDDRERVVVTSKTVPFAPFAPVTIGRPVVANQVGFSLANPKAAHTLVPWAQRNGCLVVAHTPLATGMLTGRYADHPRTPAHLRTGGALYSLLRDIAAKREAVVSVRRGHGDA